MWTKARARPAAKGIYEFVANADCSLNVAHVVLFPTSNDDFGKTIRQVDYSRAMTTRTQNYHVWMDANVLCGIGQILPGRQPASRQREQQLVAYGRGDAGCWGYGEAHERSSNLGGVQPQHAAFLGGFHCSDENDQMCYDDDGAGPVMMFDACAGADGRLFDCNHDDYFHRRRRRDVPVDALKHTTVSCLTGTQRGSGGAAEPVRCRCIGHVGD